MLEARKACVINQSPRQRIVCFVIVCLGAEAKYAELAQYITVWGDRAISKVSLLTLSTDTGGKYPQKLRAKSHAVG